MSSFYQVLKDAVLAAGIPRNTWAEFVHALRNPAHGLIPCWTGTTTPGKFILRAWRREGRVNTVRAVDLTRPLAQMLKTDGPVRFSNSLRDLACCRTFEAHWQSPAAAISKKEMLTSVATVTALSRYNFGDDPGAGGISPSAYDSILTWFRQTNPGEQRKVLALFNRPLGKRKGIPDSWQDYDPPHTDRLSLVWACRETDVSNYSNPDELRNTLGLVHMRAGDDLVAFSYLLPKDTPALVPTSVEAMGGWAFWPAEKGAEQHTIDYNRGDAGPREYVHPAEVVPNWDD
jgi:hypothetical protein